MQEISSPQFNIKFNTKLSSQDSIDPVSKLNKPSNHISHDQNLNPNKNTNEDLIFKHYETLVDSLKFNQYTIDILNENIGHLSDQFLLKDKLYLAKVKQIQKRKKANSKTIQAIKAEKYRTKKLQKSSISNFQQLQEIQNELKLTFQSRLKTQQHKNQIYQQYKDLQQEYIYKIQQLQNFFTSNKISKTLEQEQAQNNSTGFDDISTNLTNKQTLNKLREENNNKLPKNIQNNKSKVDQIQSKLQSHLQNRQQIKMDIHKITQNIKSLEHQQYQHQLNIQKLQKQKSIFTKNEHQVNDKNQYLNRLFTQVQQLRNQLDQKCQEKYGLVKYLKQIDKEEKNLRKLRKIQVECSKQQALYRKERNNSFAVLESEQDQRSPQRAFRKSVQFQKERPSQSPQLRAGKQIDRKNEVERFDTETRQRLSHIIQKYQSMRIRRKG